MNFENIKCAKCGKRVDGFYTDSPRDGWLIYCTEDHMDFIPYYEQYDGEE